MITKFSCTIDYEGQPRQVVTHETDAVGLSDLVSEFETFLRGCGFYIDFNTHLDFVSEEEIH